MFIPGRSPVSDIGDDEGDGEEGVEIHIEQLLGDGLSTSLVGGSVPVSGRNSGGVRNFADDNLLLAGMELGGIVGWPESVPEDGGGAFSGDQL